MTAGDVVIAPMLIVPEGKGSEAGSWYRHVLGAAERFQVGGGHLVALDAEGAALFIRESTDTGGVSPTTAGLSTALFELFVDDPDAIVARAGDHGATRCAMDDHERPWGSHRQGGFTDPWGHVWLVGDKSPLEVELHSDDR